MIRNKSSVFEGFALKCMVSCLFSILRIPRLKALKLVRTGCLVSLTRCTICEAQDFHFPGIPEIDGVCGQYTHKHCTYSAVQSVHNRGTHRTRLAQELHNIFVRLKRICHLVRTCLTLCCCLTCRLPRAHHLPQSLFPLPRHKNTA